MTKNQPYDSAFRTSAITRTLVGSCSRKAQWFVWSPLWVLLCFVRAAAGEPALAGRRAQPHSEVAERARRRSLRFPFGILPGG